MKETYLKKKSRRVSIRIYYNININNNKFKKIRSNAFIIYYSFLLLIRSKRIWLLHRLINQRIQHNIEEYSIHITRHLLCTKITIIN